MATDKTRGSKGESGEQQASGELLTSNEVRTGIIQLTTGRKAVQYSVVDGLAIFEGDIVLGTVAQVEQQTEVARAGLQEAVIITGAQFRWANCRIPYTIDPALTSQARVTDAIAHWEAKTNFRFVVRTNETDFVTFRPGTGCSSSVGKQGGQQFVNLADGCLKGQTIHEIGHVVGLWHEQSREDRDTFVRIEWANIQSGTEHNFNQHITDGDDVGGYDYGSIMHYGGTAFTKNGQPTIVPINPPGASIGQRVGLSAGDIAAAGTLCSGGPRVTVKEAIADKGFDTRKELIKDIRLDTRKEQVFDTRKEQVLDKRFDPIDPFGPRKFDQIGPLVRGGITAGGGALPFAIATGRQAPNAETTGGTDASADAAMQLDAQLQGIADALAQAQANVEALQQQYDETAALLRQLVEQQGQ
jgi:hypothetical protein